MTVVRVLHISDLHARVAWTIDQHEIVNACLKDAESMADIRPFDFAVFSGDLAFSGSPEEYALAETLLLEPLEKRLGILRDRLLIVPGNHDVTRPTINSFYELGLRQALVGREPVNSLLDNEAERARACERLSNFDTFCAGYFGQDAPTPVHALARYRRVQHGGISIGLLGLNSAWRSSGDEDRRALLVGDRQLFGGLQAIEDCDIKLVAVHHPLDWLAKFDAASSRARIERSGTIVLSGHEHASDPTSEVTMRGHAVYSRSGCLYETHSYANSYCILDLDTDAATLDIHIRTWWPDPRHAFTAAVHLVPDGRLTFQLPGQPPTRMASRIDLRRSPLRRSTGFSRREPEDEDALSGAVVPESLRQAEVRAYTPLYKSYNNYSFEVLEVADAGLLRVLLSYSYGIVNPTPISLSRRAGLTPVRRIQAIAAYIDGEPADLTNPDVHTMRGLILPITLQPQSETSVELRAEIEYRLPDSEVFLSYLPALAYAVDLVYPRSELGFIAEAIMPDELIRTETAQDDAEIVHVQYRAKGPVLSYWGMKLDWQPASQLD